MTTENKSNTPAVIRDLWRTPQFVFDFFNDGFTFDCDIASSDKNHFCDKWITEEQNALENFHLWGNMNWCNPPYSEMPLWVEACIESRKSVILLLPADTSTIWFKKAFNASINVWFVSGRLSFINETTGKPVSGNNKGSVLFHIRPKLNQASASVTLLDRAFMQNPTF